MLLIYVCMAENVIVKRLGQFMTGYALKKFSLLLLLWTDGRTDGWIQSSFCNSLLLLFFIGIILTLLKVKVNGAFTFPFP